MKQEDFVIRKDFTKIPNGILRDKRLSAGAKGIYVVMMRFFIITGLAIDKSMLMKQFSDGTATFNRAWNELKDYGYLKIEKKHENGRYTYEYELFDCPFDSEFEADSKQTVSVQESYSACKEMVEPALCDLKTEIFEALPVQDAAEHEIDPVCGSSYGIDDATTENHYCPTHLRQGY